MRQSPSVTAAHTADDIGRSFVLLTSGTTRFAPGLFGLSGAPEPTFHAQVAILSVASDAIKQGGQQAIMTGGEPGEMPDFGQLVELVSRLGFKDIIIETNGVALLSSDTPKQLVERGATGFRVVCWSTDEAFLKQLPTWKYPPEESYRALRACSVQARTSALVPVVAENLLLLPRTVAALKKHVPKLGGITLAYLPHSTLSETAFSTVDTASQDRATAMLLQMCDELDIGLRVLHDEPVIVPPDVGDSSFFSAGNEGEHIEAIVRVNYRCNEKCAWCWVDHTQPDVPMTDILAEATRLIDRGATTITYSGGEPTLHRDLPAIIEATRAAGAKEVRLQTNAVRFAKPDFARRMLDAGIDDAFVTLHGSRPEIADAVTELPGGFEKTIRGIHALLEGGVRLEINFVIDSRNYHDIEDFCRFLTTEFGQHRDRWSLNLSYAHAINEHSDHSVIIPFSQAALYVKRGLDVLIKGGFHFSGLEAQCGVPPCIVDGDRRYYPAGAGRKGDLHEMDFTYLESCSACARKELCQGIRRSYLARFGPEEFVPVQSDLETNPCKDEI